MAAHLAKRADHFGEAGGHGGFAVAPLVFPLFGIADLDHAFEGEQPVKRRR